MIKRKKTNIIRFAWLLIVGICFLSKGVMAQKIAPKKQLHSFQESSVIALNYLQANEAALKSSNPHITLNLTNASLANTLQIVAQKAAISLYYKANLLPDKQITLHVKEMPLSDVLQKILDGTMLKAIANGRSIRLKKKIIPVNLSLDLANNLMAAEAQETVSGTVTDAQTGNPLIGVSILVVGTSTGTTTDADGHYSLDVPSLQDTLRFSYIGYQTKTVSIKGRTTVDIAMKPTVLSGQQMVVIGFTTQQKRNITGAVNQITGEEITSRPMTNLNQGLQGVSPNLNISIPDGKPFASPTINIRGATSIGEGGNALVLIDGVEGDLSMLNPKDIKSISILKGPAAAAEYGARAAFGVVQITTKSGVNKGFNLSVGARLGFKQPAVKPGFVTDGYTYVKNFYKAYLNGQGFVPKNINKTQPFSLQYLKKFKKHHNNPSLPDVVVNDQGNYVYFASTDWYHLLYKDWTPNQVYNFSASSGNEHSSFIISGRYQGQAGLFRYNSDDYNMYNFRAKGRIKLFSWLTAKNNFHFAKRIYWNPLNVGEGGGIWRNIQDEGHPSAPMLNPDGTITFSGVYTVGDFYYGKNGKDFQNQILGDKIQLTGDFFENKLSLTGNFTFKNTRNDISEKRVPVPYSLSPGNISHVGENQNWLRLTRGNTNYYTLNFFAEYNNTLGKHNNVDFTVGTNYESKRFNGLEVQRNGLAFVNADNINLALGQGISTSGSYYEWKIFGAFYQLNYNYNHTYLLTLSGRYDGNSRFPADQRYGFFPSFAVGWLISQEPFWDISNEFISKLKIRASYGSLGNGNISPYTFQQQLPIYKISNIIDGKQPQAISNPAVLPKGLTWETVTTSDIGLDLGMFSDRLNFSGDAYIRKTKNMFTQAVTPPRVFGAATPKGNYADLKTTGWGFTLSWADHINNIGGKEFAYKIGVNLSNNKARITRFNNPTKNLDNFYVGQELGEIWGYVDEGIFESEKQIKNHANQQNLSPHTPDGKFHVGDLIYKDLNGDKVINDGQNRVSKPGDRRIIGNNHPQYRFGIHINLSYANVFVSGFFQGVGKRDWYPSREADGFWGQYNRPYNQLPKWHLKNRWTKDNPNPNALLPRYVGYNAGFGNMQYPQTRFLMNVAYIRLKNLQVGYNFSPKYLSKVGIQKAQIYVNAHNLWMYTPLQKTAPNIDPENGISRSESDVSSGGYGDGLNYPILMSVAVGINITF